MAGRRMAGKEDSWLKMERAGDHKETAVNKLAAFLPFDATAFAIMPTDAFSSSSREFLSISGSGSQSSWPDSLLPLLWGKKREDGEFIRWNQITCCF